MSRIPASYVLKAAIVFAAIAAIVVRHRRTHHPFPRFGPANQVTMVRALMVSLVAGLIGEQPTYGVAAAAVAMGSVATFLDFFDGWFARRTGMASAFGARFDMEVDALLIQVLAILTWTHGKAGPWVLLSGLLRYIFVAAGWLWPWLQRPLFFSQRRRVICVVQIAGLVIALLPAVAAPTSTFLAAISLAALLYSFLADAVWLWKRRHVVA